MSRKLKRLAQWMFTAAEPESPDRPTADCPTPNLVALEDRRRPRGRASGTGRCDNQECSHSRSLVGFSHRLWPGGRPGVELGANWYCSPDCLEGAACELFARLTETPTQSPVGRHRMPLGLLLLSRGAITAAQLQQALAAQRQEQRGRIGEWLQRSGAVDEEQVTAALGQQWACPVLTLQPGRDLPAAALLPLTLIESCRMLPVHWNVTTRTLHLALVDHIHYPTLTALQQFLQCQIEAGVVSASGFQRQLNRERQLARPREVGIHTRLDATEMARVLRNYCQRIVPRAILVCRCQNTLWVRLKPREQSFDLLFTAITETRRAGNGFEYGITDRTGNNRSGSNLGSHDQGEGRVNGSGLGTDGLAHAR